MNTFAHSKTSELSCLIPQISSTASLLITVDNLNTDKVRLNYDHYTDYDGEGAAFSYEGEELEWLWVLALSWDGQFIELDEKENLKLSLDSDGCDVGKIYLYKNSNFKNGYLRIKHHCSGPNTPDTYSLSLIHI